MDDQGSPIPLGILMGSWPSAELMAEMVKLLIEERLGRSAQIYSDNMFCYDII